MTTSAPDAGIAINDQRPESVVQGLARALNFQGEPKRMSMELWRFRHKKS